MELSEAQLFALRLRQRGNKTVIIDWPNVTWMQPTEILDSLYELEGLVRMGLMSREQLNDCGKFKYRITIQGEKELESHGR